MTAFKGQNAWEQVELNDIADKSTLKNRKNENKIVLTNSAELGIVKQQDYFDKDIANSKNLSNYYVVKNNYFVYNPRISNQAKYGPINYNSLGIVGIMSPLYFVFKVHNNVNNIFLGVLFKTSVWHRFMYENGDTGARADRFSIKDSVFMTMPLNIPSITEQSKIAKLFQSLDKTITLHEEKQRQLEQLKKALLQKMFADETGYPVLRFKAFTEKWEQRKLGETVVNIVAGGDINKAELLSKGKYPVYANALTNNGIVGYYASQYRIAAPAVTVTGRGDIGIAKARDINFTPVVRLLAISSQHNNYFLENLINTHRSFAESTGVPQLTVPQLSNYKLYFPSKINEEVFIGRLLKKMDYLTTLYQHKIHNLKRLKRALLQKMFV